MNPCLTESSTSKFQTVYFLEHIHTDLFSFLLNSIIFLFANPLASCSSTYHTAIFGFQCKESPFSYGFRIWLLLAGHGPHHCDSATSESMSRLSTKAKL